MEASGIITIEAIPLGILRLDAGGLRLVNNLNPDATSAAFVDNLLRDAFTALDGTHVTTQEAAVRLHEHLYLAPDAVRILSVVEDNKPMPSDPDAVIVF